MLNHFTDWLLGRPSRPSSDTCKSELNRLEKLHKLHFEHEHEHDWLQAHDPIDNARHEHSLRHGRRVEHHALGFWRNATEDHPESVLSDQHIPQISPVASDRDVAREHCIRSFDLLTLHDCMEEPKSG